MPDCIMRVYISNNLPSTLIEAFYDKIDIIIGNTRYRQYHIITIKLWPKYLQYIISSLRAFISAFNKEPIVYGNEASIFVYIKNEAEHVYEYKMRIK